MAAKSDRSWVFLHLRVVLIVVASLVGLACGLVGCVVLSPWDTTAPADAVCSQAEARVFLEGLAAACAAGFEPADAHRLVDEAIGRREGRAYLRQNFRDFEEFTLRGHEPVTVRVYVQQTAADVFEVSFLCWDNKVRGDLETQIEKARPANCPPGEAADYPEDWLWPLIRGLRWVVGGLLLFFFGYAAVLNLVALLRSRSWVPFLGGIAGCIGILCIPLEGTHAWAWVPLLLDWGSLPGTAYLLRSRR